MYVRCDKQIMKRKFDTNRDKYNVLVLIKDRRNEIDRHHTD